MPSDKCQLVTSDFPLLHPPPTHFSNKLQEIYKVELRVQDEQENFISKP